MGDLSTWPKMLESFGRQNSKMDPEFEQILSKHGTPKLFLPTAEDIGKCRQRWSAGTKRFMNSPLVQQALQADKPATWSESDIQIPVRDGTRLDARIYRPNSLPTGGAPVLVVFHGGGWCMGGIDTEEFQCRLWCQKLGVLVVNVAYRLSPEFPFPVPPQDSFDSIRWVAANAPSFGGDLGKGFILAGFSGGATFAAIASHLARDDRLNPPLTGVFLCVPILPDRAQDDRGKMFLIREISKSPEENKDAPLQNEALSQRFAELSNCKAYPSMTCPFLFPSHKDLPPVYIQACGLDPFRDAAFIYEGLLREAGSPTKIDVYPGVPHGFWSAYPMLTMTKKWVQDLLIGAAWLLDQGQEGVGKPHL